MTLLKMAGDSPIDDTSSDNDTCVGAGHIGPAPEIWKPSRSGIAPESDLD